MSGPGADTRRPGHGQTSINLTVFQELTVKGLEGELREMAERQQKEVSDLKMMHAEQLGRNQARHAQETDELRRTLQEEKEVALVKERQVASSR